MPIGCAGVAVYPGDVLVGDRDGVLVIPRHLATEIAEQGYEQEQLEAFVSTKIHAGEPLWGNYPPGEPSSPSSQAKAVEDVGARLGLEFFPWSNVKTLHDGLRLVEATGHDGAGVVIDVWHIERAHTPVADLASVPLHQIVGVELNDADPEVVGTLYEDTVNRRRYCGEGSFDLPGIVAALRTAGWTGPWGVEILSEEHRSLPVRDALARAAEGARRLLAAGSRDG